MTDEDYPITPALAHWQESRERDIRELREQVRNLQLAIARIEAAAKPTRAKR